MPPSAPDLFEILGLARRYSLDRKDIDAAWRARSRFAHPDRFSGQGALQKRLALQWSATLNEARRILRDPVSRAWYLATGDARPPEKARVADPDFLEAIFELQMEAQEGEDVRPRAEAMLGELDAELEGLFLRWEAGEGKLERVPDLLARRKYVDNILNPH